MNSRIAASGGLLDSTLGRCCFFSHVDFQSGFVASGSCRAGVVRAMEAPLIPHLHSPAVRTSLVISRSSVGWLSHVCILLCFLFFLPATKSSRQFSPSLLTSLLGRTINHPRPLLPRASFASLSFGSRHQPPYLEAIR